MKKSVGLFFSFLLVAILFSFGFGFISADCIDDWNAYNFNSGYTTTSLVTGAYRFYQQYSGDSGAIACPTGNYVANGICYYSGGKPCADLTCSNGAGKWLAACALSGKVACYPDTDNDVHGNGSIFAYASSCWSATSPYASSNDDCNDSSANTYPGALEICDGRDNDCDGSIDEGDICSCVVGVNYDTITSSGGYWATGCCNPPSSYWGCPPSLGGSNTNAGAGLGTCVSSVWVSTGSTTNYFCPGTSCNMLCTPNSAAGCAASCTNIAKPYWSNLINISKNISSANMGASVLMVVPGAGLTSAISYSITKQGSPSWNPSNWFPRIIQQTSSLGIKDWVTSDSGTFWFTANIGTFSNSSDNLAVSSSTANNVPVAIISLPVSGYNASINNQIYFNHSSYDEDDFLNVTWNFGDGQTYSVVNYSIALTSGLGNIGHSYSNAGTYLITLNVTEMTRGKSSIDSRTIQVFQSGLSVFPIITPINNQAFAGLVASFNASASYITNCTVGMMPFSFPTNDGQLNCSYLHSANQRTTNGYNLITNWTIQGQTAVSGNWSNISNVEFSKLYSTAQTYSLFFNLRYISGANIVNANKTVLFSIAGGWYCNATNVSAFWQFGALRLNATNNCTAHNSTIVGSCCPTGYNCDGTRCTSGVVRNYCSDFTTQASCLSVTRNSTITRNSVPNITVCNRPTLTFNNGTATCYNQTSCICTWQNGNCTSGLGATTSCPNQPPIVYPSSCFWTYTIEDNCNTTSTRILRATPNVISAGCESTSQTVACVETAKLDFITDTSLVVIVLFIVLVYVYLVRKRKSLMVSNTNKKKFSSRKIYK